MTASESLDGRFLYYAKAPVSPTAIWRVPVAGGEETRVTDGLTYTLNFAVADRGLYFTAPRRLTPRVLDRLPGVRHRRPCHARTRGETLVVRRGMAAGRAGIGLRYRRTRGQQPDAGRPRRVIVSRA